ncbi:type I restriction-modification enzyme R subunit C-terminal domain-containing protein [Aeromonas hydrophila]|uniref:type I restriction-modification enzyme R subunit C-terminal domain-containing protein n=1 Tax=Aeromonas hydrophila TaxID=644 RepID=UPI001CF0CB4A|nr:type I restriction-modification enzyme R subunit C-terminal domain-containing protein [Aeromonas hydrophila]UCM61215.1 hypothetical protein LEO78_18775 [Aeromonas hydrophila]
MSKSKNLLKASKRRRIISPHIEVWKAYEQLEAAKVKGVPLAALLSNIVSLVSYASGQKDILDPFPEIVELRFRAWLVQQRQAGVEFDENQLEWPKMLKRQIAENAKNND